MPNPLRLPPAIVDALFAIADVARRLPQAIEELAAVRRAVDPLDERLAQGLGSMEKRLNEMAGLQRETNEGIAALVRGVDPLEGGIKQTSDNTASLDDHMIELRELMARMLDELGAMRATLEPVGNTAERFEQLRRRLPGTS